MQKCVYTIKYGNIVKKLNIDDVVVKDSLKETSLLIDCFKSYFKNYTVSEKEFNLILANEAISSVYIEGFESYCTPEWLCNNEHIITKDDNVALCLYNSYFSLFYDKVLNGVDTNTFDAVLYVWKKLISYKKFLRKGFRKIGVKVGNSHKIYHIAPNQRYVKSLLSDLFLFVKNNLGDKDSELLVPIIFHYVITYIHPFLDGNGRLTRMLESGLLYSITKPFVLPISCEILYERKLYYLSFVEDNSDVDIDITQFVLYNLYVIRKSIVQLMKILNIEYPRDIEHVDLYEEYKKRKQNLCFFVEKTELIKEIGLSDYISLILSEDVIEHPFNKVRVMEDIDISNFEF